MKKTYEKPQMVTVFLQGPALMLGGTQSVNNYNKGEDIKVGDNDDE